MNTMLISSEDYICVTSKNKDCELFWVKISKYNKYHKNKNLLVWDLLVWDEWKFLLFF